MTASAPSNNGQMTVFHQPRLPYHDAINDRFQVDRAGWKVLTEAIFPNAKTADSVIMALSYCRARKLDPFKRPVHIVPMWSSAARQMVETVWPGISELRTTAFRTGQYAGKDETEFGPTVERTFKGTFKDKTRTVTVSFPEWARVSIKRMLNGKECSFASPKVYWLEAYAKWGDTDVPNDMWAKRPSGQLEKCVEAAALRCAFPEEIGNDYAAEEMDGQGLIEDRNTQASRDDGPPAPPQKTIEHKRSDDVEFSEKGRSDAHAYPSLAPDDGLTIPDKFRRAAPGFDEAQWLRDLEGALDGCEDFASTGEIQRDVMMPEKKRASPNGWKQAEKLVKDTLDRINTILAAG